MLNFKQVVGTIGFSMIIWGILCNMAAFSIFIFSKQINTIPSMRYLAFISIVDTLSLFTWNLNHFLGPMYNSSPIETWSIFNCKFLPFLQYASLQCGGLLYSILSVDRYFSVFSLPGSFFSKLPFGTIKNATLWSVGICATVVIVNLHLMIAMGYEETALQNSTSLINGTNVTVSMNVTRIVCFIASAYPSYPGTPNGMSPMWDYANMVIYNFVPFIIMLIFNSLLIQKTFDLHAKRKDKKETAQYIAANKRKQKLTVSLLFITISFIVLTLPSTVLFGFFMNALFATETGTVFLILSDIIA
jgi:hypothetical protein